MPQEVHSGEEATLQQEVEGDKKRGVVLEVGAIRWHLISFWFA